MPCPARNSKLASFGAGNQLTTEAPRKNCFDKITPEELKYLARCIELLRNQTETSCDKKMGSFVYL